MTRWLLLIAGIISACSQATPTVLPTTQTPGSPTASRTPGPTRTIKPSPPRPIGIPASALKGINIQVWHAFAGAAQQVFLRQVEQFNASNEWGIQVQTSGYSDYPGLFDAVNSALEAGQAPEVVASLPEQILAWADEKAVVDLNPYLADANWGLGAEALADIPAAFLAQDNVNGAQWALPAERSARFLYYNVTWAGELGFKDPPVKPDEFRRQACAANASFRKDSDPTNDSLGGWIVDTHWQTVYSWLLAFNGSVEDGNSYGFRTDPNLEALRFVKQLYDDHCAWLPAEPASFDPFDPFSHRLALFVSADLTEIPQAAASFRDTQNKDQWELIPFPGEEKPALIAYGPSFAVMKSTPEKQLAAWVFANRLLSPEGQAQWVEGTGLLPLRLAALGSLTEFQAASPEWGGAVKSLEWAQIAPQMASWRKVRYVLQDGLNTVFHNNMPVAQLPSILTEMDTLAQELNK